MKSLSRLVLCIGLALFEGGSSQAQGTSVAAAPKHKFEHQAEIVSVYDKKKDQTTVIMDWYLVYAGLLDLKGIVTAKDYELDVLDNRLEIQAAFVYPGRVLSLTPNAVEFGVTVRNRGGPLFKATETPELTAVVDGETISLGKALLAGVDTRTTIERPRQIFFAKLSARFTYQGLLRIVRAKTVSMKIGQLHFDLREANLEALRDLASRMTP